MFTVLNLVSRVHEIRIRERLPYKLEQEVDETAQKISRAQGWMESVLSLLEAGRAPEADAAADDEGFVAAAVKQVPVEFHHQPAMIWTSPLGRQQSG